MIVITSLSEVDWYVLPGDEFCLTVTDEFGHHLIISEMITVSKVINYVASYRFALEDGSCPYFHLSGIFANKNALPREMKEAVLLENLTPEQRSNFVASVGIQT